MPRTAPPRVTRRPRILCHGLLGASPSTTASSTARISSSVTLFDAETADLTATLTTGTQTGSQAITVNAASAIAGIGITGITQNTTPLLSCTGGVGSITCSSTGESASSGNVLTASIQLEDQYGNATVNATANPLLIDLQATGGGNVVA